MSKEVLNKKEKAEINADVKDALSKAILKNNYDDTMSQSEIDNMVFNKNKKKKKFPILISILIIFVIALTGIYFYLSNNPRTIFSNSLHSLFSDVNRNFNKYNISEGSFTINSTSDYLNYIYVFDNKNKTLSAKSVSGGIDFYVIDGKSYVYNSDVSDKYIELSSSLSSLLDIKRGIDSLEDSICEVTLNKKIIISKDRFQINGKDTEVRVSTLNFNNKEAIDVLNKLHTNLNEKRDFVKIYNTLFADKFNFDYGVLQNYLKDGFSFKLYSVGINHKVVKVLISTDKFTIDVLKENNKYTYKTNDLTTGQQNEGTIMFADNMVSLNATDLNVSNTYSKTSSNNQVDVSNSININNLSSDEKNRLNNIIGNNKIFGNFIK